MMPAWVVLLLIAAAFAGATVGNIWLHEISSRRRERGSVRVGHGSIIPAVTLRIPMPRGAGIPVKTFDPGSVAYLRHGQDLRFGWDADLELQQANDSLRMKRKMDALMQAFISQP